MEMLVQCCTEFIHLVASQANEVGTREKKNTIQPEHVLKALTELGFDDFVADVASTYEHHKEETKQDKLSKFNKVGGAVKLTEAEQILLQQQLFEADRVHSMTSETAASAATAALFNTQYGRFLGSNCMADDGGGISDNSEESDK
eukprot:CAMPEP_0175063194 /NCGR_PEP_ID=MMETSP0052_2-20121109/14611_1 /TAXON_ID=51329 ORGANISM="Polytomella parva, Strain SAG 63-3" /NCGR_SAMPLE_ID=MMETSP0052_2 /ASSEMBLY_ACC=CAM_ASM_000194 /LENGTH=144 /DNA_ID=CAMNT_0016329345 /DNA_START=57 /DNA_END=491 /DNA_ORIENTATION=+